MLVDFYHMSLSGEGNVEASVTGSALRHVHIARPLGRGLPMPGDGEDYTGFFQMLHSIGYYGDVSIEAYIPASIEASAKEALTYLKSCEHVLEGLS